MDSTSGSVEIFSVQWTAADRTALDVSRSTYAEPEVVVFRAFFMPLLETVGNPAGAGLHRQHNGEVGIAKRLEPVFCGQRDRREVSDSLPARDMRAPSIL